MLFDGERKIWKSDGARSGEWGGCGIIPKPRPRVAAFVMLAVSGRAL